MGYARLYFPNNGTVSAAGVVRDIVGVVTGAYTTVGQLLTATQNLSEIVNSAGRGNWTRVFSSTLTLSTPYVLSAACLNGQNKFVQIGILIGSSTDLTITSTAVSYGYDASAFYGIGMISVTAATSATAVSNPSFLNIVGAASASESQNRITGNFIYISWSSRHLLLIGNQGGTGQGRLVATGCFEHSATGISAFRNTAPFCHVQYMYSGNWVTAATPVSQSANAITSCVSSFYAMNHFSPLTTVATGAFNVLSNVITQQNHTITANQAGNVPEVYTKTSTGATAIYMQPLFWHQHQSGIPHQYISDLSKVYRIQGNIGTGGDRITLGADTYMYFSLWSETVAANAVTLAVLRA